MSVEYVQPILMVKEFQGKWFIKPSHKYVWHTYEILLRIYDTGSWYHSQEIPPWFCIQIMKIGI